MDISNNLGFRRWFFCPAIYFAWSLILTSGPVAAQEQKNQDDEIRSSANDKDQENEAASSAEKKNPNHRRYRLIGNNKGEKKGGVVYSTGTDKDGEKLELKCDVYVPNGEGPFPAIIAVHGGAWRSGAKWHMMRHAWKFMADGYVVVAINYRHAPTHKFPTQIHDVKRAVRWMRYHHKKYKIDPERLVAFGYSAGGHLVSLLGTTDPDDGLEGPILAEHKGISTRVKAVVAGGAPCEFSWIDEYSTSLNYWMGSSRASSPQKWQQASPLHFISKDDPPFWIFHGAVDNVVPGSSSEKMNAALKKAGIASSRRVYPNYGHFSMFSNLDTVDVALDFFNKTLKRQSASDPNVDSKIGN